METPELKNFKRVIKCHYCNKITKPRYSEQNCNFCTECEDIADSNVLPTGLHVINRKTGTSVVAVLSY